MQPTDLRPLLVEALESEFGTRIKTNDPAQLRRMLAKQAIDEQDFSKLRFRLSPQHTDEVWIVKPHLPTEPHASQNEG